jgi:hypothetical protein
MVGSDLHVGTSSDDVVHLVFAVRLLGIGTAFRQNVYAGAHGRDAEEFEVEFVFPRSLAGEIVDMEEVSHVFVSSRAMQRQKAHCSRPDFGIAAAMS